MTDGNEDAGLVSAGIAEMKRERRLRREALQNGVTPRIGEMRADAGELSLPSAPPPPAQSPAESFAASGGTLAVPGDDARVPSFLPGGLTLRVAFVVFWVVVLLWAGWSIRRSRKESSHGGN